LVSVFGLNHGLIQKVKSPSVFNIAICMCNDQSPEEHETETAVKSKEARKYIFNNLDDMAQVI